MFGNEKMCEKYRINFCVFFSTKTRKRYERADTKHEIYLTRPKGKNTNKKGTLREGGSDLQCFYLLMLVSYD